MKKLLLVLIVVLSLILLSSKDNREASVAIYKNALSAFIFKYKLPVRVASEGGQ